MAVTPAQIERQVTHRLIRDDVSGCLNWSGAKNDRGYGYVRIAGKLMKVHRAVYESTTGEDLTPDVEIDHLCCNRACANRDHMEATDHAENTLRIRHPERRGAIWNDSRYRVEQG